MPLRLNPDEHLRAPHRHAQRPPQLDAQDPCRLFGVGFSEWQNQSRSRIGSGGEGRTGNNASLKDHRPPWDLPACPSFAGDTDTNTRDFDVSTSCIDTVLG